MDTEVCGSASQMASDEVFKRYTSGTPTKFDGFRKATLSYCRQSTFSFLSLRLHMLGFPRHGALAANS